MAFMTYLVRHQPQQTENKQQHSKQRSQTLPTVIKKKKEIGDYILFRTIGRGASGKFSSYSRYPNFDLLYIS
jgi:hypothetical protein